MRQLTGEDFISGAETCLEQGCHIVVVTLGEGTELQVGKGADHRTVTTVSYIRDAGSKLTVEPHSQGVVFDTETTGLLKPSANSLTAQPYITEIYCFIFT